MTKILVIDDDNEMRGAVSQTLLRAGYEVTDVSNGDEGLRAYRASPFDLVVSDVVMPEKDGLEFLIQMRREFPDSKVILISGGGRISSKEYLPVADKLGASATLAKPFQRADLLAIVKQVLG